MINTITQDDLNLHRAWRRGEPGGVRLDRRNVNLSGADLSRADLSLVKADIWDILDAAPDEVPALRNALMTASVDGSTYSGPCACLVGTIAIARGVGYCDMEGIKPDWERPAERWCSTIDTTMSHKHPVVALTIAWVDEWTTKRATL